MTIATTITTTRTKTIMIVPFLISSNQFKAPYGCKSWSLLHLRALLNVQNINVQNHLLDSEKKKVQANGPLPKTGVSKRKNKTKQTKQNKTKKLFTSTKIPAFFLWERQHSGFFCLFVLFWETVAFLEDGESNLFLREKKCFNCHNVFDIKLNRPSLHFRVWLPCSVYRIH